MDLLTNNLLELKQRNDRLVEENDRNIDKIFLLNKMNSALTELKKLNDHIFDKFDAQMRDKFLDRNYRTDSIKWSKEFENAKSKLEKCDKKLNVCGKNTHSSKKKTKPKVTLKRKSNSEISQKLQKRVKGVNTSDLIFDTIEKYRDKKIHYEFDRFICDYRDCGEKLLTQFALKVHKRRHEESKPILYKCIENNCFEYFLSSEKLRAHQISKHNVLVNKFVCFYCGQRFKNENRLKNHDRDEHFGSSNTTGNQNIMNTSNSNERKQTKTKTVKITFPGLEIRKKNLLLDKKRINDNSEDN